MKHALTVAAAVVCLAGTGLPGQVTYPYIDELRQNYGFVKNNLLRLAEKMPDEHYSFKPTPEIRSFGEAVAQRSKLGLLAGVIAHSNEQYGYMAVYPRLKGIVPPSTELMNQPR